MSRIISIWNHRTQCKYRPPDAQARCKRGQQNGRTRACRLSKGAVIMSARHRRTLTCSCHFPGIGYQTLKPDHAGDNFLARLGDFQVHMWSQRASLASVISSACEIAFPSNPPSRPRFGNRNMSIDVPEITVGYCTLATGLSIFLYPVKSCVALFCLDK